MLLPALALAASCGLEACGGAGDPAPDSSERPDIILISIESLRADHLGCYGYERPTSPAIDQLARGGVRCANAVSTTSWTLPAHAALFTGLNDSAHGVVDHTLRLADAHVTLAEALREAGYQTAGFFGGPFLHPTFGLDQGFDTYRSCLSALPDEASEAAVRTLSTSLDSAAHEDVTGPRILERFETWLETAGEGPIFVFLHMWDPHYDYIPPRRYVEMFDPDYSGSLDARNYADNAAIHAGMPQRDLQHVIALYDAEIRFTSDVIGEILDRLHRLGRRDKALIVVTADHGEEFFEHGDKGHHRTLYDEVILVPLIFHWPGHLPAGAVVEDQVRLIDVMPTILSLVGLPAPERLQGRDLSDLLRGGGLAQESAHSELLSLGKRFRSERTEGLKVMVNDRSGAEVYLDLREDPGEKRPLTRMTAGSRRLLEELRTTQRANAALHQRIVGASPEEHELPEDVEERLRLLGYIGEEKNP